MTDRLQSRYQWVQSLSGIPSPAFVVHLPSLEQNAAFLDTVQKRTGVRILLAQKAFSLWKSYPVLSKYLSGTSASSLWEARLGREYFPGEVHTYAPAYSESEIAETVSLSDKIIFNSTAQYERFGAEVQKAGKSCGIRLNPEFSTVRNSAFDPCAEGSRLGVRLSQLSGMLPEGIEGVHIHALCGSSAEDFENMLTAVDNRFGHLFSKLRWINLGGGTLLTAEGFDIERVCGALNSFMGKYPHIQLYLEPGEAVSHHCGVLVSTVLDLVDNGGLTAVLDISAAAHIPDALAFDYTPIVLGAKESGITVRLAGNSCLAGDLIGSSVFETVPQAGDSILFADMAGYTMVKTNAFNGLQLPSIWMDYGTHRECIKSFTYEDFKNRLS